MNLLPFRLVHLILSLTLKGPVGGGGGGGRDNFLEFFFSRCELSWLFSLKSCATFSAISRKSNRAYGSKVMQHYVIERRLKIWKYSGFVYKTYGKWLLVPKNSILSSKMQYLLSLQLKSLLYLLIFNTQTIPYKIKKYINCKNKEIHKKFTKQ